jgi:hypothetical protein
MDGSRGDISITFGVASQGVAYRTIRNTNTIWKKYERNSWFGIAHMKTGGQLMMNTDEGP